MRLIWKPMLSRNLEATLNRALLLATKHQHEYATYEHLLLALLHDKDALCILEAHNVDVNSIKHQLENYLQYELVHLVNNDNVTSRPTAGFKNIVHKSAVFSHEKGYKYITGANLLAEFFSEPSSVALALLQKYGLNRPLVITTIEKVLHAPTNNNNNDDNNHNHNHENSINKNDLLLFSGNNKNFTGINAGRLSSTKDSDKKAPPPQPTQLHLYAINLNDKVQNDDIGILIGREREIERTIEVLCRKQKNNPLLVGEPGVGKTAIAEGLAYRIVHKTVPSILKNAKIFALDLASLVSGTRYRGDFEERVKNLLHEVKNNPSIILFIDEIHTIIGAGSTNNGALDAGNLIKPALSRGEIRCLGATTFREYHKSFSKDQALTRRFQKIIIEEPSAETTFNILQGVRHFYEKHHNVYYSEEALASAVTLSGRHIHDRHFPDKAIDVIDEAGAQKNISGTDKLVSTRDIEYIVAKMLHIPPFIVQTDDIKKLKKLEFNLKSIVFGQDKAIEELCSSIKMAKAGLKQTNKPTGCYIFAGPTGTGKTELAKQLASFCSMELLRFDMSEYMEAHSISRLIGTPPGYIGYDQGGLLSEAVSNAPYSVVLFDEIEKAHKDIFNILLQVMDYGKLTDSSGKVINFSHTIIILTTNVGSEEYTKSYIGFTNSEDEYKSRIDAAISQSFTPEFRNRLDKIILFNLLTPENLELIVYKSFKELASQLADKNVRLIVDKPFYKYILNHINDQTNEKGARALERIIDREIKQIIAEEILFGQLANGGVVRLTYKNNEVSFKYAKDDKVKKKVRKKTLEPYVS